MMTIDVCVKCGEPATFWQFDTSAAAPAVAGTYIPTVQATYCSKHSPFSFGASDRDNKDIRLDEMRYQWVAQEAERRQCTVSSVLEQLIDEARLPH